MMMGLISPSRQRPYRRVDRSGFQDPLVVLPRFDNDPIFCRLLSGNEEKGFFDSVLDDVANVQSKYGHHTAILSTAVSECLFPLAAMSVDLDAGAHVAAPSLQSYTDDNGRATVSSGFRSAATPQIIAIMEAKTISAEPNR